jgi:ABC-type sugar transport system ATPase subunit
MSPPEKTMLEIIRAMMLDCQLLVLDEPTAALTNQESEQLFALIKRLTAKGTAILYVSHRLEEIFRISDRITIFRNGKYIRTERSIDTNKDQLIQWMSDAVVSKLKRSGGSDRNTAKQLEVNRLSTSDNRLREVSLFVRQGEIVGIFGLAGAGRTELLEAIYGLNPVKSGSFFIDGQPVQIRSPRQALDHGIVLIPEERKRDALIMNNINTELPCGIRIRDVNLTTLPPNRTSILSINPSNNLDKG